MRKIRNYIVLVLGLLCFVSCCGPAEVCVESSYTLLPPPPVYTIVTPRPYYYSYRPQPRIITPSPRPQINPRPGFNNPGRPSGFSGGRR